MPRRRTGPLSGLTMAFAAVLITACTVHHASPKDAATSRTTRPAQATSSNRQPSAVRGPGPDPDLRAPDIVRAESGLLTV